MNLPKHIAIIMDGNGRWATEKGLSRSEGHLAGAKTVELVIKECLHYNIPHLSLYAFSTENWNRPKEEVNYLFELFCEFVAKELSLMQEESIRFSMVGDKSKLPESTLEALENAIQQTQHGNKLELTLALNYSGTQELLYASRQSAIKLLTNPQNLQEIQNIAQNTSALAQYFTTLFSEENYTEELFRSSLYLPNLPDPDLIIRTSGELRLSNFYLIQAAYSEFYFTQTYWPDFSEQDFAQALQAYSQRKRRFGKIEK